ncbi:putative Microtubule associated protein [Taphrina deformans PYCC 5710]|uniref:Microtubule associated protein n=1 Tax=Taphrina deformans (strain PYCC 5710 / ATCC 11124 / CBS 356.35 / IMI 108563 / JCM 9778 / NBRC 8474) TaxID=1097556 RepID=R4XHC4_TAPDE|nr:putative Microtubule associated protein [Taphrina deformans PYCC 5710]|eukprot:CCG82812.1 putative Microtubule associated protein [Taphrina deformans PYCC 5710]
MDDNVSWLAFKDQLQSHYEALESYHRELGGDYENSSATLIDVLQAALQASLQATKLECDRVRADCESMLQDMSRMRLAMGDTLRVPNQGDPFTDHEPRARVKAPLLDSQKVLRIEHSATRRAFEDRALKVTEMYRRIQEYSAVIPERCIGIEIPSIDEDHPPEDVSLLRLGQLDTVIATCSQEVVRRKRQVQAHGRDIVQLWAELAIETHNIDSEQDRAILLDAQTQPEKLGLMDEDISSLHDKRDALIAEKQQRKDQIDCLKSAIQSLHRKLHLPEADLIAFTLRVRGFARSVITMCEEELARLVELKKDHIEDFVRDARVVIADLWERLYYGEEQKLSFTPAYTDVFTDASLQAHENEILKLRAKVEELTPLLTLVAKHMGLVQEREDLEVQVSDSSRFSKRGYNPMAESKLRTRIENTMPKIEEALRESLAAYEQKYFVPFRIGGELYLDAPVAARKPISRLESGQSRGDRSDLIDPDTDNPLATTPEDDFEFGYNMSETPSAGPTRRRSSLGMLLRPFKAVSPSSMASSIVSALSTNLSSWAASMASTQYDDGYGLLSSLGDDSIRAPGSGLRRGSLHQGVPRPIRLSGPQKAHATIIDAEMERPLLVPEQKPVYVELAPWSSDVAANTLPAPPESRSREPRMNPDFLRILVLESNMRKLGKISETTGRARMILSPRCGDYRESRLRFSVSC